jgi:hypothetical protein
VAAACRLTSLCASGAAPLRVDSGVARGASARRAPERRRGETLRTLGAVLRLRALWILLLAAAVPTGCGGHASFPYEQLAQPAKGFPAPPSGSVVFARELGVYAVGLAVAPDGRRARVSVVGQDGHGVRGLRVRIGLDTAPRAARPLGPGSYEATFAASRPHTVNVAVRGRRLEAKWHVKLPGSWPPQPAAAIVRQAAKVWRGLRSVVVYDHLATGPRQSIDTTWTMVAPDRLTYHVVGRGQAVIIGKRRWDRRPGGQWIPSVQDPPVRQPAPFWVAVADAHVLGSIPIGGGSAWRISFYDPKTPAWFEAVIDRRTMRTLDLRMVASAHFMHDSYSAFDARTRIRPPVAR